MISFITVSNSAGHVEQLAQSLRVLMGDGEKITHEYELVTIDGSVHDIFNGYNEGARRAKGEVLAFVHHDVRFLSPVGKDAAWLSLLNDPATGFVGIAGSCSIGKAFFSPRFGETPPASFDCAWWCAPDGFLRGAVVHTRPDSAELDPESYPYWGPVFGPVLVLDGVLLMCRRDVFDSIGGFDEQNYRGWHFYDIDITFRASLAGYRNFAADLPVLHTSTSRAREEWHVNRAIFEGKFRGRIPTRLSDAELLVMPEGWTYEDRKT